MHFYPLFLAYVGQPDDHLGWLHQCPSHQFILFTQEAIPAIFPKNIENWCSWKMMKDQSMYTYFIFTTYDFAK